MTSTFRSLLPDADSQQASPSDFLLSVTAPTTSRIGEAAAASFTLSADTFVGTDGNDTFHVDNVADVIVEAPNGGQDTVYTSVDYTLPDNVELLFVDTAQGLRVTGNGVGNDIQGNVGNDTLDGGGGDDRLYGGLGDDVYIVNDASADIHEAALQGTDRVEASVSYWLNDNLETLVLTGTAAINGTGNGQANTLVGNSAANQLSGNGGGDTMTGGAGNDTYFVSDANDLTIEAAGGGTDIVLASASFTLQTEIERLTLTGSAAINGTGNSLVNIIVGNAAGNVIDGGKGADSMYGGAGDDTYVFDDYFDKAYELAGGGNDTVRTSVSLWLANEVENLALTGSEAINGTGNLLANILTGNAAANQLNGREGADTMTGGAGNDTYFVDNIGDVVTETGAGENDTVKAFVSWTLGENVENLVLLNEWDLNEQDSPGDSWDLHGTGNALDNAITGNSSDNVLDGGAGADTLSGGYGNDTYVVDTVNDQVLENYAEGTDSVFASASFKLQAEIENLTLTGSGAINGTGNLLANQITGNAAANVLTGGAGVDTMTGGAGNDTYVVDGVDEKTIELAGGGTDLVQSSASFTLQDNVENLTLTGAAVSGTGNGLANAITGNATDNTLNGGTGVDTLTGGAGNDTYIVDNTQDKTVEVAGEGIDTVKAGVAHTLQDNVENLTLIGTAAFGTGNGLANVLTGNATDNRLDGGTGIDTLVGGAGNDTYVVDNTQDKTVEADGRGVDTVKSSVAHTLQDNVENLTLTGTAVFGTGNALANVLTGNASANTLNGGASNDTLTGGAGADIFALTSSLGSDLITDFASGVDKLRLSQAVLRVGDGDTAVENAVSVASPNGFNTSAELVVVTHDIAGSISPSSAAAAVGHASSNYAVGDTRLFIVDNGSDSAVYLFKSADVNSIVSASELTLLATLDNTASTTVGDYLFGG